jgi:3-oxoacyl-[acyl-carrier protein] reductase
MANSKKQTTNGVAFSLSGRTALVTGGSLGIGRGIARRFVEAGAKVILVARRRAKLAEAKAEFDRIAPGRTVIHACDVADGKKVAALCKTLTGEGHRIDILVNNAGTSNRGEFEKLTDKAWQEDLDLKLFAAIRLSRFVLPGMKKRRWGRILNVVAINGKMPGARGAPTAVSRAAGIALTKVLSNEFAGYNILVNALCTGIIMSAQTDMSRVDEIAKTIPLGRLGMPEEYANVALLLASDAGSYVTGSAINIDGGLCKVV